MESESPKISEQTSEQKSPAPQAVATPLKKEGAIEKRINQLEALLLSIGIEGRGAKALLISILILVLSTAVLSFYLLPSADFPAGKIITVKKGASLSATATLFEEEHLIRSQAVFQLCIALTGGDRKVASGDYYFKEPIGSCSLASRLTSGKSGIPQFRAVITEGMTNRDIADLLTPKDTSDPLVPNLAKFDPRFFMDHAHSNEGFLFPDTYFFASNATAQTVETTLRNNFDKKIEPFSRAIEESGHSLRDVVVMASIIEKEARTPEDMALVSGILWKRIKLGMPLQVDATFFYLLGKQSSELTESDLATKSAYNTYKNKGLPAGPIGNPGLTAIKSAIDPKESPYLYYLSGGDGVMHYAKTFDEHKVNKVKYLNR